MRTRPQLINEIYQIVKDNDLRKMKMIVCRKNPRSKGFLDKLSIEELESIIPRLKEEYGHVERVPDEKHQRYSGEI